MESDKPLCLSEFTARRAGDVRCGGERVDRLPPGRPPRSLRLPAPAVQPRRAAGVRHVVYHSVYDAERFLDVPHFASKFCVEQSLIQQGVPHTAVRPNYFHQNDAALKPVLTGRGVYPMPLGEAGVSSVDMRDIAEATALALMSDKHVGETIALVGPAALTGPGAAAIWSDVLGKPVKYGGNDMDAFDKQMVEQQGAPGWSAFDIRMMFQSYLERGFAATDAQVAALGDLLGHPPRSYDAFARETAAGWAESN